MSWWSGEVSEVAGRIQALDLESGTMASESVFLPSITSANPMSAPPASLVTPR
jgi:hypothetical protein